MEDHEEKPTEQPATQIDEHDEPQEEPEKTKKNKLMYIAGSSVILIIIFMLLRYLGFV